MIRHAEQTQGLNEIAQESEKQGLLLMGKIANQDRKAFEDLYFGYTPRIGRFLMKLLKKRELVDEAVNDVMLAVWQQAGRYDPAQGKLSTWLFGIAHNKGLKLLERQRRHQCEETFLSQSSPSENGQEPSGVDAEWIGSDNPERTVMGWEMGEHLLWAMELLSLEHRTVIELAINEQCSYQEIALITDCPVNTVKTRMFHARKKLAELLASKDYP
ncbi:MAG: sigma-70 family RNA polymerase sigma factor [Methylovulum sp.]|uniref:sigma-70 family RNA polymerase sigma factor n=1 Tax=Methylovulum sp. TaxID=1916980 RepID=UPI00260E450F|nr:sigma-70 family RNA polymerase sigma factor [Methylovulum sp.]MDD2724884.1 sigma-70 family RNA polymerase sigma factor [Methylovulum sp.]MDD5124714.1 sigma-70 family RNA polymerase sigma factor [Methylovulum sp.]